MFRWGLKTLTFNNGAVLEIQPSSTLIFIGPNSSGKSVTLRNILQYLQGDATAKLVVGGIEVFRDGEFVEFDRWLSVHYPIRTIASFEHFVTRGIVLRRDQIQHFWGSAPPYMVNANPFLVHLLDAQSKLLVTNYTQSVDLHTSAPSAYAHVLQMNEPLLQQVSSHMHDAFGVDLMIDWTGGNQVGFRVGIEPHRDLENDRVSQRYAEALRRLPRLDDEGDGMRSFAGTLLAAYCGAQPVLLVDEPEAFLHPPQARRLGRILTETAQHLERQLIVATHSSDVIQGALDSRGAVAVCRLTREADVNPPALLESGQLRTLWAKPLLRSAATLDGLFHRGAVICEADGDVRFYEATLRRLERRGQLQRASDLYFTHGGGKGGLATLAGAYVRLKTKTAVIADLDLLRNETELASVLIALGHDFEGSRGRYNSVKSTLAAQPPLTRVGDLVAEARQQLTEVEAARVLTTGKKVKLQQLFENAADWSEAKRYGIERLRGGVLREAEELLMAWEAVGLFLVPRGELEGWWHAGPAGNKAQWILEALTKIEETDEIPDVDPFVIRLCNWFGD